MAENPLLSIQYRIPFHEILPAHVEPGIRQLIDLSRANIEQLAARSDAPVFENTLLALERATENLDYAMGVVRHLESVMTSPELRAAWNAVEPEASAFYSSIPLNEGLWNRLKQYAATDDATSLTGPRRRLLKKTLDSFRRHGADLNGTGKIRLASIDVELSRLTTKFSENVLDSTNAFELVITDEAKLAGLPPSAVAAARQNAESRNLPGWRFTLQSPSYIPAITYLDDRTLREHIYLAYSTRATEAERDNRPLILQILALRQEKARLLGAANFADFILHDRMAHNGETAVRFLESLKEKTDPKYAVENLALARFAGHPLEPWDISYYAERKRRALYDFDEEQLRPYFSATRVVEGMFSIVEHLYGITVKKGDGVPVWHPDVTFYEVHDRDGALLGSFYADWFPRETKRDGA